MHKKIRLPWLVLFAALLTVLPAVHALAADAGFSVIPQMPENQAPTTKGYYDILVQPGQEQTLTATVSNKLDEEIVVTVEAVTASTNRNGIVDYTTSEGATLDESMAYAFADLVRIPEKTISIPPGSGKTIAFTVTMPDQPFDGIILGALHVKKELSEKERAEAGTIINQYSYAIGVRIAMSSDEPLSWSGKQVQRI